MAWPNLYIISINNGNRTEWSPIWSVIIHTYVMSMITDRIVRHEVPLPISHDHYNFRKKKIHLGQTSPVGTMSKATNLEISQFFFSEQVVVVMVIVINSVIGGFSRVTQYDWLLQLSDYRCLITAQCLITLSDYNDTE